VVNRSEMYRSFDRHDRSLAGEKRAALHLAWIDLVEFDVSTAKIAHVQIELHAPLAMCRKPNFATSLLRLDASCIHFSILFCSWAFACFARDSRATLWASLGSKAPATKLLAPASRTLA